MKSSWSKQTEKARMNGPRTYPCWPLLSAGMMRFPDAMTHRVQSLHHLLAQGMVQSEWGGRVLNLQTLLKDTGAQTTLPPTSTPPRPPLPPSSTTSLSPIRLPETLNCFQDAVQAAGLALSVLASFSIWSQLCLSGPTSRHHCLTLHSPWSPAHALSKGCFPTPQSCQQCLPPTAACLLLMDAIRTAFRKMLT